MYEWMILCGALNFGYKFADQLEVDLLQLIAKVQFGAGNLFHHTITIICSLKYNASN